MKHVLHICIAVAACLSSAVSAATMEQGNSLYANGEYTQAAEIYAHIIDSAAEQGALTRQMAPVYYNLGNSYFRCQELSKAILAYERCLRLDPRMKDARYNLQFAQTQIIDNIADTRNFFLRTWVTNLRNALSESIWMWMSIGMFSIFLIGAVLFALTRETWLRKTAFYLGLLALVISISAFCNATSLHHRDTLRAEAIITQGIVNAKASPDRSGTELFTMHEGTKVTIRECLGEWCNVQVGNNEGWIKLNCLERI